MSEVGQTAGTLGSRPPLAAWPSKRSTAPADLRTGVAEIGLYG